MKKVLSIVVAMMMALALSVTAFADVDLVAGLELPLEGNKAIEIPAGTDVSNGATVTLNIKGTSDNTAIRFYLTDANDVGRVTDVTTIEVVDGAFEATIELYIDYDAGFGGTAAPTHIMVKGPDWQTAITNTIFEVLSVVGVDAPVEEPAPEEPAVEDEPVADEPAEDTAPEVEAPAETGVVLALVPAAVALAVVVLKRR